MFVYKDMANLKSNIDSELFILNNQIKSTSMREDEVYKSFIQLPIDQELNLANATILDDFNTAFSSATQTLEELKVQKSMLEKIKSFVIEAESLQDPEEELDNNPYLSDIQDLLTDYYSYRNDVQKKYILEENNLYKLKETIEKFNNNSKVNKFIPLENTKKTTKTTKSKENKTSSNKSNKKANTKVKEKKLDPFKEDTFNKSKKTNDTFEDNIFKQASNNNTSPKELPLRDNRLLYISEKENKVYLPYYATDLQQILLKSDYEDYDELIENDFVVSLDKYKNPFKARFVEGFKLMRKKEFESIRTSLSYSFKLMRNDRLHPAIISACRTFHELNTYLDCLEENKLNSFNIFDIKFDITPLKK